MTVKNLLAVGRAMGLENVSAVRGLRNAIKSGAKEAQATFTCRTSDVDKFMKIAEKALPNGETAKLSEITNIGKYYFPKAWNENSTSTLNIAYKMFGKKSGRLDLSSIVQAPEGIVARAKAKILANTAGIRATANTEMEGAKIALDTRISPQREFTQEATKKVAKGLDYVEANGVSNLSVNVQDAGPIRNIVGSYQVPTGFLDNMFRVQTGESKPFGMVIQQLKSSI